MKERAETLPKLLFEARQRCRQDFSDNRETSRVDFVERILRRVPVGVAHGKINKVAARHAAPNETKMIVAADRIVLVDKGRLVAELPSRVPNKIHQPFRRTDVPR